MLTSKDPIMGLILSIIAFPLTFQDAFIRFAWGAGDEFWIMMTKRLLIMLPVLGFVFCCWLTVVNVLTIIFRSKRREFANAMFVTWWDFGRAVFSFWGGLVRFIFFFVGWIAGLIRVFFLGLLLGIKDIILAPVRMTADFGRGYFSPGIPWPAVMMMVGWSALEALIFTFIMTPLVVDVLSGITATELDGLTLQLPLYLMFFVFVLGSYAVVLAFGDALRSKDIGKIVLYTVIEGVVAIVEIAFLYREFVEALVPWFAQHAGDDFELGIFGTFAIAGMAWAGIRAMTWFLFGAAAVPTILAIVQRTGLEGINRGAFSKKDKDQGFNPKDVFVYLDTAWSKIKKDIDWVHKAGDNLLSAFVLPPLQIVAACVNFCTLCISSSHLFDLPFKSYKDVLNARSLLESARKSVKD